MNRIEIHPLSLLLGVVATVTCSMLVGAQNSVGERSNTFTDEQDSFQIGASVRVPLYQSGEEYSLVREYRQTAAQRRRELDRARRDTREDFARGWEQLITARARISSFEASVRANQIALDGVEHVEVIDVGLEDLFKDFVKGQRSTS